MNKQITKMRSWIQANPVFAAAVIIGSISVLLAVAFLAEPANDVAAAYAPQVREFADGNWPRAFNHMIPPLVPVLAGLLAKVGVEPFAALKLVSGLFFLAGLWPLRGLLRRLAPSTLTDWGCLMYIVCPRLLRYGTMGTLDGAKIFLLLATVERAIAWMETRRRQDLAWTAVAMAGLGLTRCEGGFFLPLIMLLAWMGGRRTEPGGWKRGAAAAAVVASICLALWSPWLAYQYRVTGYFSLDSRQTFGIQSLLARTGMTDPPPPFVEVPAGAVPHAADSLEDELTPQRSFMETLKGLYPPYLGLGLLGIWSLLVSGRPRRWSRLDLLCLTVILYNIALFVGIGFITKRYISPTIPFLLPWAVIGAERIFLWLWASPYMSAVPRRRNWLRRGIALLALVLVWDGMSKVRPSWPPQPDPAREVGRWIAGRRQALDFNSGPALATASWGKGYHNGRQPVIAACEPQYSLWAEADFVPLPGGYLYPYETLAEVCHRHQVDLLITGRRFFQVCPEFTEANRHFELLFCPLADDNSIRVYRFVPAD